jgi:nicotinate-nucleotide adenylyltransferase
VCVQEAFWHMELDKVVLMPAGEAPHKRIDRDPGRETRFELCELAALDSDWLEVSRLEIDRDGPAYTVDTLERLRAEDPGRELVFIVGADQAMRLTTWREPSKVLSLARMAVAERGEHSRRDVRVAVAGIANSERLTFFPMPQIAVSSSDVRIRVAAGRPYRYLVPARVADRIEEAGLYREHPRRAPAADGRA